MSGALGEHVDSVGILRLVVLAVLWAGYCGLHSALASRTVKGWVTRHLPRLAPAYRLFYNLVALAGFAALTWLTFRWRGPWLWRWEGIWELVADGLALTAVALFFATWLSYDMLHFFGLRQLRENRSADTPAPFRISPLHRHVRHPWYTLTIVALWTRDMEPARLVAVAVLTAYLILGFRLEERKLVEEHGDLYREYRRRVPALLPRPWKRMTPAEAERLTRR